MSPVESPKMEIIVHVINYFFSSNCHNLAENATSEGKTFTSKLNSGACGRQENRNITLCRDKWTMKQ